jgi:hypothetical protein
VRREEGKKREREEERKRGRDHFQDRSAILEVKCDGLSSLRSARNWPAMQITIKGDRSLPKIK